MKKNVASQKIGAQMVSASDGSAFTSAVTVYVTIDAGTQAIGSVGSGACTHEGNGYHTYAPAQAETNGDLIAFTFIGTGAVPGTVQVFTSFPQTGDAFDRLGAPAGASVSADMAAVKVDTTAILVDTGTTLDARIPAALVSGRMDVSVGAMAANVLTATAINADAITAAKVAADVSAEIADQVWDEALAGHVAGGSTGEALGAAGGAGDPWITALPGAYSAGSAGYIVGTNLNATVSSRATQTSVDTIDDLLDTEVAAIKSDTAAILIDTAEIGAAGAGLTALATQASVNTIDDLLDTEVAAIKAKTDLIPAAPAAVGDIPTAVENADALLGRNVSGGSSSGRTVKQAFHFIRNKWVVAAGTLTVYDTDDTTSSWTSAVTGTAGADPITATDPS